MNSPRDSSVSVGDTIGMHVCSPHILLWALNETVGVAMRVRVLCWLTLFTLNIIHNPLVKGMVFCNSVVPSHCTVTDSSWLLPTLVH